MAGLKAAVMRAIRVGLGVALFGSVIPGAAAAGTCSTETGSGGEWRMYGHDLEGTRHQTEEDRISPATVGKLRLFWTAPGANSSTPVVAGNCVYVAGTTILGGAAGATVRAYDLETGELVWSTPVMNQQGEAGTSIHAVAVVDGTTVTPSGAEVPIRRVHLNAEFVDAGGGQAFAFDAVTGEPLWVSEVIEFGYRTQVISSAMVFEGVHWLETYGPDGNPNMRPGYAAFDAATGKTLHKQTTVPAKDLDDGYASGGMWGTPVFDIENGYFFNGTANPSDPMKEHLLDNSIIKIDARPGRSTFGRVVASYKGSPDSAGTPSIQETIICEQAGTDKRLGGAAFWNPQCNRFDLDMVSPQLFRNPSGDLLVGAIQRDGNYHVANAGTMNLEWKAPVSHLDIVGNAAPGANDGKNVYVLTNRGPLFSLEMGTGKLNWVTMANEAEAYHPLALANGVLFAPGPATLGAYDASNGVPLWHANLAKDSGLGQTCANLGGGVAIARHTVIVNCDGGMILAYRLDPDASPVPVGSLP